MTEKEVEFKKQREIGDIFSDSFRFLGQEFKPLTRLISIYVLPFLVLYAYVLVYIQQNVLSKINLTDQEALLANIGPVYLNIFLFAFFGIFVQSLLIAAYYTYIDAYVKNGNGNFNLSEITPQLFSNGLLAIGAGLVVFIVVILGLILCFVPGIYFANTLSLVFIIILFEKKGLGNAFLRSAFLVNKQWWATFLINFVGIILIWAAGLILSIPASVAGLSVSIFNSGMAPTEFPGWYWVMIGFSAVVTSLLWIIPYTFMAMQYFNLDERMKQNMPTEIR